MKINTLGIVLSHYRRKENLTLNAICGGLCSSVMLERIEHGERIADSLLGELLLERIGKEACQFELLLNREDYVLWNMRNKMQKCLRIQDYEQLHRLIAEYRTIRNNNSNLHEQFCLYCEAMAAADSRHSEQICELAWKALQITKNNIGGKHNNLYTQTEISLILLLIENGYMDSDEKTEDLLLELLRYVETFYTERRKEETGVIICLKLFELAQKCGYEKQALKYINKGIAFVSQGRGLKGLEELHFLKAKFFFGQYNGSPEQEEQKQEIQKACLMAYCICEVMGFAEKMKEIEKFCEEKLAWQIMTLEM